MILFRVLVVGIAVACAAARAADPAFVAKFREEQAVYEQAKRLLQDPQVGTKQEELKRVSTAGMEAIEAAVEALKSDIDKLIDGVHGSTTRRDEPMDPFFPFRLDQNTHSLIRAYTLQGNAAPGAILFQLVVGNVRLVSDWLTFAHAGALGDGKPRMAYGSFQVVRSQLSGALDTAQRFFPSLPPFPASREEGGRRTIEESLLEPLFAFFSATQDGAGLPNQAKDGLRRGVQVIDDSVLGIENYHNFYPQKNNEAALQHLTLSLSSLPGFHECVSLARGLSDFEGEPCQPKAFEQGMKKYIDFYEKNAGASTALLSTVLEYFANFKEDEGADPTDQKWDELRVAIDWHIRNARFHDRIKERWPGVSREIFGDKARLKRLYGNGPGLHDFLREEIRKAGLAPKSGFEGDYFENVHAAKIILEKFQGQKLEKAPESFERIRASTSCKAFLDKDTANSPWTVNTLVAADLGPRDVASTAGGRRLIWAAEAKAGNAVAIQNTQLPDKMLGGLSQRVAMMLVVPNLVQTRLLMNKGAGEDLNSLGVRGDGGDALKLVMGHFRLPEWKKVVAASEDAYWGMIRGFFEDTKREGDFGDARTRRDAEEAFREKFKTDMREGAERLREIQRLLDDVKQNAARNADPAIATILQIPTAYTGEEDRRMAAQINESLIQTFLPTIIAEYIYRKWPESRRNRDVYAQHYNQLKGTFTIDQFMDQMEWYAWPDYAEGSRVRWALVRDGTIGPREPPYDGAFRKPGTFSGSRTPILGHEEFKLLYRYPVLCARLLNHTLDSYQRKLDYLDYAQKQLFYRFPALKWKDEWKRYDDARFDTAMEAFLENASNEANKVMAMKSTKEILDYFVPNLPLMNTLLRYHPDQKLSLCEEQRTRKLWEERTNAALTGVAIAATAVAYVPVLAPVGLAVDGIILVIEAMRAYEKYQQMQDAERLQMAGASQLDEATMEENRYLFREMEMAYAQAMARFAITAAAATPAVVMQFPKLVKIPGLMMRTPKAFMRAAKAMRAEYQAARQVEMAAARLATQSEQSAGLWFQTSKSRLARAINLLNTARHKLMSPLQRLGVVQRWTHKSFYERFYLNFTWRRAHRFLGNIPGAAKDLLLGFPFSVMGYSWGNGLLVQGFQFWALSEMSISLMHAVQQANDVTVELVMERVHQDPATYGDLMNGMYEGEYRQTDLIAMVRFDDKLGAEYRKKATELMDAYSNSLSAEERSNAIKNLEGVERDLGRQIDEEEKRPNGADPNKVRIMKRTRRQVAGYLIRMRFAGRGM